MLRATQFFEFPDPFMAGRSPVVVMPNMLSQPVAAADVATALAEHAAMPPMGMAPDLAGPEQLRMVDMARRIIRARQQRRIVLPVSLPGKVGKAMSQGELLPQGETPAVRGRSATISRTSVPPRQQGGEPRHRTGHCLHPLPAGGEPAG